MCSAQYVMCNSVNDVYVCKEICVLHNMLCSIWQMIYIIYMYAMKYVHCMICYVQFGKCAQGQSCSSSCSPAGATCYTASCYKALCYVIQCHAIQQHVIQYHVIQQHMIQPHVIQRYAIQQEVP